MRFRTFAEMHRPIGFVFSRPSGAGRPSQPKPVRSPELPESKQFLQSWLRFFERAATLSIPLRYTFLQMRFLSLIFCIALAAFAQDDPPPVDGAAVPPILPTLSTPAPSPACACATSARPSSPAASLNSRSSPILPATTWSRRPPAASGSLTITVLRGPRYSTITAPTPSAGSPSIPRILPSSGSGTGENNDQRSVSFGDGVYKSEDGGRT